MRLVSLKWAPHLCRARTTGAAEPWEDRQKLESTRNRYREDMGLVGCAARATVTWRCECLLLTIPV